LGLGLVRGRCLGLSLILGLRVGLGLVGLCLVVGLGLGLVLYRGLGVCDDGFLGWSFFWVVV